MEVILNFLLHVFFFVIFISLYLLIAYKLRVYKIHPRRPVSTIALKVSYMLYLGMLMFNVYAFLFFSDYRANGQELISFNAFLFVILVLIPNMIIYFRKRIFVNRILYNYLFSFYNVAIFIALLYAFLTTKWIVHM
jgi:hypothetical protein